MQKHTEAMEGGPKLKRRNAAVNRHQSRIRIMAVGPATAHNGTLYHRVMVCSELESSAQERKGTRENRNRRSRCMLRRQIPNERSNTKMAPQSQSDKESRTPDSSQENPEHTEQPTLTRISDETTATRDSTQTPESDTMSYQSTPEYIEAGAAETIEFVTKCTGKPFAQRELDRHELGVLHQLTEQRKEWDEDMDLAARGGLQLLHLNIGGSAQHGPQ